MLKILHIILIVNILVSTNGLLIFEHICQKKGTTSGIFIQSKNCCSKKKQRKSCDLNKSIYTGNACQHKSALNKKPCCEDRVIFSKYSILGIGSKMINSKILIPDYVKYQLTSAVIFFINTIHLNKISEFLMYKPPVISGKIFVFIHSFLC